MPTSLTWGDWRLLYEVPAAVIVAARKLYGDEERGLAELSKHLEFWWGRVADSLLRDGEWRTRIDRYIELGLKPDEGLVGEVLRGAQALSRVASSEEERVPT